MAAHSSIFAWKIPWITEPGRLRGVAKSWTGLRDFTFTFTFWQRAAKTCLLPHLKQCFQKKKKKNEVRKAFWARIWINFMEIASLFKDCLSLPKLKILILPLVLFPLFLYLHGKWFDEYFFWRWFSFSEKVTFIILAWSTDHTSPWGAYLDGKESCFGNSNFTCLVAPPFRDMLGLLQESVENAVHMLSNARNCANTTLIFISNWKKKWVCRK